MKFFNIVNEEKESIGDLWLGIDKGDELESAEEDGPLHVEITLMIDENNLVEVMAVLKERPNVKLSKTLSRGKADEKLFLSLEKTIAEANRKDYNKYQIIDLTYRSLSAIKDINSVIHPETGEVDQALYKRVTQKIEKSIKMVADGHSSKTTIYYANSVLNNFGPAIPLKNQADIRKKIKRLEEMDEHGTYEQNLQALTELDGSLDTLGGLNVLMQINKAGEYCMQTDPARAPKFYRAVEDILKASAQKERDKVSTLMNEIMPEVYEILDKHEEKTGVIYKDIAR